MENMNSEYLSDRERVDLSLTSPRQEPFIPFTCPTGSRVLFLGGVFLDHASPMRGLSLLYLAVAVVDLH